jgi:maltooligosyltrehalose trehalohydrolase
MKHLLSDSSRQTEELVQAGSAALFQMPLGAHYLGENRCSFNVWAPNAHEVSLILQSDGQREIILEHSSEGYYSGIVEGVHPGARYFFRLGDKLRPDPASRFQPETVHDASEVISSDFRWQDGDWTGLQLRDYILYEIHVGTATPEGTFEAIIPLLSELKDLGITAIELMPIAQFPGNRNWGYDGVYPYAVQNSYGGPTGLKRLINSAHHQGLAVVLDVVYNHLGPEGNYLREFGPYFTDAYKTPWGDALNFDGKYSNHVRRFFLENALRWQEEFHVDALRLDAVHAIRDFSAIPFLQELVNATTAQATRIRRPFHLFAESDLNDARLIRPPAVCGIGLHAQWSDDFHHALHVLLTNERSGYYEDLTGGVRQLAKTFTHGFAYCGDFSPHRKRHHGNSPDGTAPEQFVVYSQNHDQIGNRMLGERTSQLMDFERLKVAAGVVLLSPFTPMLFMGEEYGEKAPFQYFISHGHPELIAAVCQGRREEFAAFGWQDQVPDPSKEATFKRCILDRGLIQSSKPNRLLYHFYRELFRLRKALPAIRRARKEELDTCGYEAENCLSVIYPGGKDFNDLWLLVNFSDTPQVIQVDMPLGTWQLVFDSKRTCWGGVIIPADQIFHSDGIMELELPEISVGLLERQTPASIPPSNGDSAGR